MTLHMMDPSKGTTRLVTLNELPTILQSLRDQVDERHSPGWRNLFHKLMVEKFFRTFDVIESDIVRTLTDWILTDREGGNFPEGRAIGPGIRAEQRLFSDYEELGLAVIGELASRPTRERTRALAEQTYASAYISGCLNHALSKIRHKLADLPKGSEIREELANRSGTKARSDRHPVGTYEYHLGLRDRIHVLDHPATHGVMRKIVAIHDLSEYFQAETRNVPRTLGTGQVRHPRAEAYITARITGFRPLTVVREYDKSRGKRQQWGLFNRNELNSATISGRITGIPLEGGQSMTTARMLELTLWANCDPRVLEGVAWAIFAFWRLDYDKLVSPAHTFHEVMDVAKNYLVPYDEYRIPSCPPKRQPPPVHR